MSSCPSKDKGGDLGWFKKGQMVAEFEAACFENDPGTIVKVQTQFGWHVVSKDGKDEITTCTTLCLFVCLFCFLVFSVHRSCSSDPKPSIYLLVDGSSSIGGLVNGTICLKLAGHKNVFGL